MAPIMALQTSMSVLVHHTKLLTAVAFLLNQMRALLPPDGPLGMILDMNGTFYVHRQRCVTDIPERP